MCKSKHKILYYVSYIPFIDNLKIILFTVFSVPASHEVRCGIFGVTLFQYFKF